MTRCRVLSRGISQQRISARERHEYDLLCGKARSYIRAWQQGACLPTKAFNQAVQRNLERFPADFMFRLTEQELMENRSQIVTGSQRHRNPRNPPWAFTEHGVAMLSAVLRSERAVQVSISIVRTFVKLRELLANNKAIAARAEKLEAHQKEHRSIIAILAAEIDELKSLPEPKSKRIM